jgi:hypothetical protein
MPTPQRHLLCACLLAALSLDAKAAAPQSPGDAGPTPGGRRADAGRTPDVVPAPIGERMLRLHADVPALLKSDDPVDQAWGAWIAGRDQLRQAVPLLEWRLAQQVAAGTVDRRWALTYTLDALIQLEARPPVALLEAAFEERADEALILLARGGPRADAALLALLDRAKGARWLAAANVLTARRTPGLAARLLHAIPLRGRVVVSHGGVEGGVLGGGVSGLPSPARGRADRPPDVYYPVSRLGAPGQTLLADGPIPIYYRRAVAESGAGPDAGGPYDPDAGTPDTRLRYVAALLPGQALPLAATTVISVEPGPRLDADAVAHALRVDVRGRFEALVQLLLRAEHLTPSEAAGLTPEIQIEFLR